MKAWKFNEFGDIKNLHLQDVSVPEPGDGEVLIKLECAALNPADRLLVEGIYPGAGTPPLSVGRDGGGIVEKTCSGLFECGDEVIVLRSGIGIVRDGTLAEYVVVPEESVARKPEGWSLEEAAAGVLVHLTAWRCLVHHGELQRGQTVLVTGATGGVGTAAIQQAKFIGARVVAMSRNEEKRQRLKDLGADIVVDSSRDDLEDQVREALDGEGVHVVVENLGGKFLQTSVNLCGQGGRIGVIGLLGGPTSEVFLGSILFKEVRIEGVAVGAFTPRETQDTWREIVNSLDLAGVRPLIDRSFPMDEVQEAFQHLRGDHMGKVLIDITG